jgi:transcriptional regulator GlxA family with amidase domain
MSRRRGRRLRDMPLAVGMSTAILTSSGGVSVNVATQLVDNPIAWAAVAGVTAVSGLLGAWVSKRQSATAAEVIEEQFAAELARQGHKKQAASRRTSKNVVKRRTTVTRPDGTVLETVEFFSEELAREDK